VDSRGERLHLYHPDGESVLKRALRFLAATPPEDLHQNTRKMGNGDKLWTKLRDRHELDGLVCPKCRKGKMEIGGPSIVSEESRYCQL